MRKIIFLLVVLTIATIFGSPVFVKAYIPISNDEEIAAAALIQEDGRCKVADPTGRTLNVRSQPNGKKVVRKLKNGTIVFVVYETGDAQDRPWSKISLSNKGNAPIIGWVLREYLECD